MLCGPLALVQATELRQQCIFHRRSCCPGITLVITGAIQFTADDQEISTQGYPTKGTRAAMKIASGNTASTLISGKSHHRIRIRNVQLDGDRPHTGFQVGGGANVEIGGLSTGQVVDHVASRNPRGWSCRHLIGSGSDTNPCKSTTVTNCDIGPCGTEGKDSACNGLWADSVSLDCTASLVQSNKASSLLQILTRYANLFTQITGSTDGGIVIFGSPGSTITGNTTTSSSTDTAFGAINMVDDGPYSSSYASVTVTKKWHHWIEVT